MVTLRHPERQSRATFYPQAQQDDITCPPGMWKVRNAAVFAMTTFATEHSPVTGGSIDVISTVPHSVGMGSSTADVTATIRAIADFHGATPSAEEIGRVAIRAEYASDPLMIDDRAVLFAHREGVVLETLGPRLPSMIVVGCDADPVPGGIDTVALTPAEYSDADIGKFCDLRSELRAAVVTGDVAGVGRVATASALINQRFLPKPSLAFLLNACHGYGGCGVQVAHSGTLAGVIFDPRRRVVKADIERCVHRIQKAGLVLTDVICS